MRRKTRGDILLVIIRYPYSLRKNVREELIEKYRQLIRYGDCVLLADPMVGIEVYENFTDGYLVNELVDNSYRYNFRRRERERINGGSDDVR